MSHVRYSKDDVTLRASATAKNVTVITWDLCERDRRLGLSGAGSFPRGVLMLLCASQTDTNGSKQVESPIVSKPTMVPSEQNRWYPQRVPTL